MVYLIVSYESSGKVKQEQSGCRKQKRFLKLCKLWKYLQKYIQLRQLVINQQLFWDEALKEQFMYITVQALPKELEALSPKRVCSRLRESISFENSCLLQAESALLPYIPSELERCMEPQEIYIKFLKRSLAVQLERFHINKKHAKLLFLVEDAEEAAPYIQVLAPGWNYVSVCAKNQEGLEAVYERLYEEEGLMVQEAVWDFRQCQEGDVAVDLTKNSRGIYRMYPENAPVLDIYVSREKERMLASRNGSWCYMQLLRCPEMLGMKREE